MGLWLANRKLFRLRAPHAVWPGPSPRPCAARATGLPVATAPGGCPTRPWRALRPRRVRRWPFVVPGPAGPQGTVAHGRGKRGSRFLAPPGGTKAVSPLQWQGPSPLPQRHAAPWPAGGQCPRPAPDPPPAGASLPPGRARACRCSRTCRSAGHRPARAGKRGSRFLFPPGEVKALSPPQWRGPSPLPKRYAFITPAGGPKPPAGAGLCFSQTFRSTGHRPAWGGSALPFLLPPGGAIPVPKAERVCRHACGRSAVSAACPAAKAEKPHFATASQGSGTNQHITHSFASGGQTPCAPSGLPQGPPSAARYARARPETGSVPPDPAR